MDIWREIEDRFVGIKGWIYEKTWIDSRNSLNLLILRLGPNGFNFIFYVGQMFFFTPSSPPDIRVHRAGSQLK